MIRVMLVDDHTLVREALRSVLEQAGGLHVVAEVGDGETALQLAEQFSPDIVVMDVAMPGLSGIETTRLLLAKLPNIKVLALSTYLDRRIIVNMLEAGALGYVLKSAAGSELTSGIFSVAEGRPYFCAKSKAMLDESPPDRSPGRLPTEVITLTARERQVVALLAGGSTAGDIATRLFISPRTVEVHRRNIMSKLNVHNVVELTKYAIQTGLISA